MIAVLLLAVTFVLLTLIAIVGTVSATVTAWVATADWLPLASVTCADTVAVPLANSAASLEGIVALQPVPAAFTVAVELLVTPAPPTVTRQLLLAASPVTVPVSGTPPAAWASAELIPSLPSTRAIVTVGTVSAAVTVWVAVAAALPAASDTLALML